MDQSRRKFLQNSGVALGGGILSGWMGRDAIGSPEKRPNILLFFPDQHRYDWIGTNSAIPVRTPHLDAAGERGVRFTRAVCPSPLCAPSRACLALGREYDRCRVPSNHEDLPLDETTFYKLLRDSGYHVAGCGKFDLAKNLKQWGLDGKLRLPEWGFSDGVNNAGKWDAYNSGRREPQDPYMAYLHEKGLARTHIDDFTKRKGKGNYTATFPTPLPEEAYCDNWTANVGLELMNGFPKEKPWFLQVNFPGPHPPVDITKRMEESCRGPSYPPPNRSTEYDNETHNLIRQNYSAMVENIDRWFGIYLEQIRRRGEIENTVLVFSSDHGEMLGDHNQWGKSKPGQPSIGVPLVIAGPGIRQGVVWDGPTTTLDLTATFLDYGKVTPPDEMDSRSFRPYLEGRSDDHREFVRSVLHGWRTVTDDRFKLVWGYGDEGKAELYDLVNDPLENENLAGERPGEVERLRSLL